MLHRDCNLLREDKLIPTLRMDRSALVDGGGMQIFEIFIDWRDPFLCVNFEK